jgi:hypothetical protein
MRLSVKKSENEFRVEYPDFSHSRGHSSKHDSFFSYEVINFKKHEVFLSKQFGMFSK